MGSCLVISPEPHGYQRFPWESVTVNHVLAAWGLRNGWLGVVQSEQFTRIVAAQPFFATLRGLQHFESSSVLLPE